jgi:hypothetical protein
MSALPKPLQDALRPFAPSDDAKQVAIDRGLEVARLRRELIAERDRIAQLLRTPFELDMGTDPYRECLVTADEEIVLRAVDECIVRHMDEIQERVAVLLIAARDAAARDL